MYWAAVKRSRIGTSLIVYTDGLVTIGEDSVIPAGVRIGKNTAIIGKTEAADYPEGILESGESIIKAW